MRTLSHPKQAFPFPDTPQQIRTTNKDAKGYKPSPELVAAINIALALGQPLLVTGEPGTGKTELAKYIADCLDLGDPIEFVAQTTSTYKNLFYQYDALGHFQWAQVQRSSNEELDKGDFLKKFVRFQGLGEAIKSKTRRVVLIDEIDKAPRDLPNDLLAAIDKLEFEVVETPGQEKAKYECKEEDKPIVIITSNSEKNLPDAFLRRVVYFHIDFPNEEQLLEILKARTEAFEGVKDSHLELCCNYFIGVRNAGNLNKKPATAELIAWVSLLIHLKFPIEKLADTGTCTPAEKAMLQSANSILGKTKDDLNTLHKKLGTA